jgi:SNF2 family DNA or RNA helicase
MMEWPEEWDFQNEDVPFFLSHLKSMVLYEPRLGKTVVTCKTLALDPETRTVVIACSKNAFQTWMDHIPAAFARYAPNRTVEVRLIRGKGSNAKAQREAEYKKVRTADVTVYITTFNALINDYPFLTAGKARFDTVVGDEVHTKLKKRTNKSCIIFRDFVGKARRFMALSGTLAGKWGPADYWAILNMCNRKEFPSFWNFVHMFCHVVDNGFGMEVTGIKNIDEFRRLMDRYARLRLRKTVRPQMPQTVRALRRVEMTPEQAKLYSELEDFKVAETPSGGLIVAANSLEENMRRRQILACPAMLDPKLGVGGAFEDLVDQLLEAKENDDREGQHLVVYSAFRRALDPWENYLRANGFNNVWQLYGGTEPEELTSKISKFKSTMGIILCTTKFAQAFSLASAKHCYHIGYEYDPNDNIQADDRLVPTVGDYAINSTYYSYRDTADEIIAERINIKQQLITLTVEDHRLLK